MRQEPGSEFQPEPGAGQTSWPVPRWGWCQARPAQEEEPLAEGWWPGWAGTEQGLQDPGPPGRGRVFAWFAWCQEGQADLNAPLPGGRPSSVQ